MDRSEEIVRATLLQVCEIIRIAAEGARKIDHVGAETMRGVHTGLLRKTDEIVRDVLEKL